MKNQITLTPTPAKMTFLQGEYVLDGGVLHASLPKALRGCQRAIEALFENGIDFDGEKVDVKFIFDDKMTAEGYLIKASQSGVEISYSRANGAFYALMTLRQILLQVDSIPFCEISDCPKLSVRGFMLDISRNKVPTLSTLKAVVDLLSTLKFNQLQLYIEGFSFKYKSFAHLMRSETPLEDYEIKALDLYCRERFIELVPSQNTLGHMAKWLEVPQFHSLAEKQEGLEVFGMEFPPTTLDCQNVGSIELVRTLTEELLPNFTSNLYNVNMDEPFELGKGKNKELADNVGSETLYLKYVQQIHQLCVDNGKQMMMWGDVIANHANSAEKLANDIIVIEWGYEKEHPFKERAKILKQAGKKFILCCGTSSWNSIVGMTDNMMGNVTNAITSAMEFDALGAYIADWGDLGHLQPISVSLAGTVLFAQGAWSGTFLDKNQLANALDALVFQDKNKVFGGLLIDAGNYSNLEQFKLPCRTLVTLPLIVGVLSKEKYSQTIEILARGLIAMAPTEVGVPYLASFENKKECSFEAVEKYLENIKLKIHNAKLTCKKAEIIVEKIDEALNLTIALEKIMSLMAEELSDECKKEKVDDAKAKLEQYVNNHERLWIEAYKSGNCDKSIAPIERLLSQLENI